MNFLHAHIKFLIPSIFLLLSCFCFSQNNVSKNTLYQELEDYEKLIITTDLDSLISKKRDENWLSVTVKISGKNKIDIELNARVKARGKFRRMTCDIPPIKIDFSKGDLDSLGLKKKFDRFKIVNPCFNNANGKQDVIKEFWIYQMYGKVTDHSFKTHQLNIIYQDENNPKRIIQGNGFIIEPDDEMAKRIGGELTDTVGIDDEMISSTSFHHAIMFYYMVGNTDWNISTQKNIKLVKLKGDDLFTMIPYDFDMSKLVNPAYMIPYPDATFYNYKNRYVKNHSRDKEMLIKEIEKFSLLKKSNFQEYLNCEILSNREKKRMTKYLKSFYKTLEKKNKMVRLFWDKKDESR